METTPPLIAIGYVRVSTEAQAKEGVSLEAQEARIRQWAEMNGHELAAVYVDAGVSGKRAENRPELQKALEHVSEASGALVFYSLSRLARSTKDAISMSERLEASGADMVSLSESIDTTTAAGKMIFRMLAVLAEFERDTVSERTKAALSYKKSKGERVGGIPYGFRVGNSGELIECADEQDNIYLARCMRDQGRTYRDIQARFASKGIRNRRGNTSWGLKALHKLAAA